MTCGNFLEMQSPGGHANIQLLLRSKNFPFVKCGNPENSPPGILSLAIHVILIIRKKI